MPLWLSMDFLDSSGSVAAGDVDVEVFVLLNLLSAVPEGACFDRTTFKCVDEVLDDPVA